jgi:hypothetical protein
MSGSVSNYSTALDRKSFLLLTNFLAHIICVLQGLVSEDTVKDCNSRLFKIRMKLGEFDPPDMNPYTKYAISWL